MNEREKYINDLSACLSKLSAADRNDALEFYDEYIADAGLISRQEIEQQLGTPRNLSRQIIADLSIKKTDHSQKAGKTAKPRTNWRIFWVIFWAIIAVTSPLTFGLALGAIGLMIAVATTVFALTVAGVVVVSSLAVAAVVTIYAGITVFPSGVPLGLFYLGTGLSLLGLFFICLPLIYWFICWLAQGSTDLAKKLYNKIQARRNHHEKNA